MSKKYALVTGANKGIGLEIVKQLEKKNYHVFLGSRDESRGQAIVNQLNSPNISFVRLDVTDANTIATAREQISTITQSLDLLINNAGVALDFGQNPLQVTVDTLKKVFDVNYFGTFQVIQAFLPLITAGKIINVTTDMSSQTLMDSGEIPPLNILGYNSSKTALNALTLSFGIALKDSDTQIFNVTPGFTSTDLNRNAPGGKTTAKGAEVIVRYAIDQNNYNGKILNESGIMPW